MSKKVMFLAHEGVGLGHIARTCKIANHLSEKNKCLVVTGSREAAWLLKRSVDFVKLPSLDGLITERARYLGTKLYFDRGDEKAIRFRKTLAEETARHFAPDIIFIDHTFTGKGGEYKDLLLRSGSEIFIVLRPVLGTREESVRHIFGNLGADLISVLQPKVLVAGDARTSTSSDDVRAFFPTIPIEHVGYLAGLGERTKPSAKPHNILCSSGSGFDGEMLSYAMCELAEKQPDISVTLIVGPRGSNPPAAPPNVEVILETHSIHHQLERAQLVVCHGGYNSVIEAMSHHLPIVVFLGGGVDPIARDERRIHSRLLSSHYPLLVCEDVKELPQAIQSSRELPASDTYPNALIVNGLANIANLVAAATPVTDGGWIETAER